MQECVDLCFNALYMWIIEVVPIKKGLPQDTLTYFSADTIREGSLVSVPMRSKLIDAIVIGCRDAKTEKAAIKSGSLSLRKVTKVKNESPVPEYIFETATLASRYFRRQRGDVLDLIISDYSAYASLGKNSATYPVPADDIQSERLVFQSPLEERISYYKTYIREAFARKESVTIVCPTIADCEFFAIQLSRGIADFVVILHSEVSKKKFTEALALLHEEKHPLVLIATPTFASLVRPDVGTIILEHENSPAYTTPTFISYDFRVIIEILARCARRKLIIADSLLRIETLGRYESKELGCVAPITFRALAPIEPTIVPHGVQSVLSSRERLEQFPALSEYVQSLIAKASQKKSHVFLFTLRTGLATITRCRDCFHALLCEHCEAPLVLYQNSERRVYICNKCKRHKPSESKCTRCESWNLSAHGLGTEYVEEEVKHLFPELPVFRIDRESTPSRTEAREIAAQFSASPAGVLVGTEMALYYLSSLVTDSVIVSFDTLFNIPSYRTNERIVQLLLSIAERTKGRLLVQTKNPTEPILELVAHNNYASWYRNEVRERAEYNYPPFSTMIKCTWIGKESDKDTVRDHMKEILAPYAPDIFDGAVMRKGKKEVTINALIRPKHTEWSLSALFDPKGLSETLRQALAKLPEGTVVSINPDNLLS